ncbi:septation protein IspZ [Pseudoduganella namucuonensis]|uniref:septation protein IspZ n=1 Tax=Pseudoduganella namucuonensis TaxID=1035707 RepID=UPI000B837F32|nr:septation protein IspZ [Pseudoduganella namucuonensis]
MPRPNPYAPPAAPQQDTLTPDSRSEFGVGLAASLFWRVFFLQLLAALPVALSMPTSDEFIRLKPTVIYLCLALILVLSMIKRRPGILSLIWGRRLGLAVAAWRKFHWLLFAFYLALAAGNLVLVTTVSASAWVQIKLFVPLIALIAFCVITPRQLRNVV